MQLPGPENSERMNSEKEVESYVSLGTRFTLGRPEKGFYRYLLDTPSPLEPKQKGILPINGMDGIMVTTTGILKMSNGSRILCLVRADKEPFYGKVGCIYAIFSQSLKSRELIPL